MFNPDFFPTPPEVINTMLATVDVQGKVFLEPSAGKGNIVDVLNLRGASQVLAFEKSKDLQKILQGKCELLGDDFLTCTREQVSHVNYIVMNPPFSADEKHILHAWEVAPEGCEIIALCNSQTLINNYSRARKRLDVLVRDYGDASMKLGDCFSTAERKTNVEVTLVRLFKPITSKDYDWEGFFLEDEPEYTQEGVIKYNEIRTIVSRYIAAVKCFTEMKDISHKMNGLISPIGLDDGFFYSVGYGDKITTKSGFSKALQKKSWEWIFKNMDITKYVTSGVMEDINKFVETQSKYPFTMKNIYKMIEIIIGTRSQTMDRALVEVFDKITERYHDNRYNLEGWKSNSHYLVNKRFIIPYVTEVGFSGELRFRYGSNASKLDDLHKALCFISGTQPVDTDRLDKDGNPELLQSLNMWAHGKDLHFGTWYDWGFLEVKGFKKGTLHCKFKCDKVWESFNRRVAEIKGYPLPENL